MASSYIPASLSNFISYTLSSEPRDGLNPIPGSKPLTLEAAICPPLVYYVALLFLAPSPPSAVDTVAVKLLRNALAALAGFLFFRLPLAYHVPQSIGLTYQLGLVGLYGGCRVLDAFFISPYLFGHVPRRVRYTHKPRARDHGMANEKGQPWSNGGIESSPRRRTSIPSTHSAPKAAETAKSTLLSPNLEPPPRPTLTSRISASDMLENMTNESYTTLLTDIFSLSGPAPVPVTETATTESDWPTSFADRASWALELEFSMRGVGFTWTTADVRHSRQTWLPTVHNRVHSILVHVGPTLLVSWAIIRSIYVSHIAPAEHTSSSPFDTALPLFPHQFLLTAALGAFLMAAFSLGHSLFAILLSPLAPRPLSFFPPLYTSRIWDVTSVRGFWGYGWHRLFARLFLVYGVWPGEWVERVLTGKKADHPADIGKVVGGFASSAFVHSFAVRGVLGGKWADATGEAWFFAINGMAVVVEEGVERAVRKYRKARGSEEEMRYDGAIGRAWWIAVLLWSGRSFARGWVKAGLVREMAFC